MLTIGLIATVIGLIFGCQGGKDTSAWLPVLLGGLKRVKMVKTVKME